MAKLLRLLNPEISKYRDRRFDGTQEQFEECLRTSTTAYVGNLSFFTTEEQLAEVFSKVGDIKRIIMGLDKQRKTPCGFCFVVYYTREDVENAVKFVNGTLLDDRPIRVDFDWGFKEGRQFGRGRSGGQVRDEYRIDYDSGRGGFGHIVKMELLSQQAQMQAEQYAEGQDDDESTPVQPHKRARTRPRHDEEQEEDAADQRGGRYRDDDDSEEDEV